MRVCGRGVEVSRNMSHFHQRVGEFLQQIAFPLECVVLSEHEAAVPPPGALGSWGGRGEVVWGVGGWERMGVGFEFVIRIHF